MFCTIQPLAISTSHHGITLILNLVLLESLFGLFKGNMEVMVCDVGDEGG